MQIKRSLDRQHPSTVETRSSPVTHLHYTKGTYNVYPQGCCLTVLARFGWFNLDLDDIFLERWSLLQEAISSKKK
jgi:hypothetical protein